MKKNKSTLIALALATIALGACGPTSGGNGKGDNTSESAVSKAIYMISASNEDIPVLQVNEELDLSKFFTVEYKDGTSDKNFSVSVSAAVADSVRIEGTKITPLKVGTYDVEIVAGTKSRLITVDCRSQLNIDVIKFFEQLSKNPKNFSMDLIEIGRGGKVTYDGLTAIHNEKYFVWFDKTNPGAQTDDGEQNSTILALLSDDKGYWGSFDVDGKPVFDPGAVQYDNYIVSMGLELDGGLFSSEFDELGDETLTADASVTHALLYYGMPVESDKYTTGETEIVAVNKDAEGNYESLDLITYVYDGGKRYTYAPMRIYDLGTSKIDSLEPVHTDASYIPAALDASDIVTTFEKANAATNYTITTSIEACDADGNVVASPDDTYAFTEVFGGEKLTQVTKVTEEGIDSTLTAGDVATKHAAYFNKDGKAYGVTSEYNKDSKELTNTTKELEGVTDAKATDDAKAFTPAGVTATAINASSWTKKVNNSDGTVSFQGKVGDDTGTEKTNAFYAQLMDQMAFVKFGEEGSEKYQGYGSYLSASIDGWGSGEMHALTINSSYQTVKMNPATGEATVTAAIRYPASKKANLYWLTTYTISAIGTTTADFSSYLAA